jgi:cobalt-zinc-cadmium efflux system membrane fusion protein
MLYGTVRADEERVLRLSAPYPGHVRDVRVSVGDRVRKGDVLALMQNKESLAPYTVKAPRHGVIISRHVNPGELTHADGDEALFVLADLSRVWIDFAAFPNQYPRLKVGQAVDVRGHGHDHIDHAVIRYIAPVGSAASQSILVRAVLDNSEGHWVPGLLVTGDVVIADNEVPLAVKNPALQTLRETPVVFVKAGDTYTARRVKPGRRDETHTEVLQGLEGGAEYVTDNSFLIKADLLKSDAGHDHAH